MDVQSGLGLLAVLYMAVRAHRRSSLTSAGILAALVVGTVHALHPYRILPLLLVFFLCGTKLTGWGHDIKAELLAESESQTSAETKESASPSPSAPVPAAPVLAPVKRGRTATQVFCNSGIATLLALIHMYHLSTFSPSSSSSPVWPSISHDSGDLLLIGIVSQYACSAGDTFSSEIGILNDHWPVLITTLQKVPPGTNGAVSLLGLVAALMGGSVIGLTAAATLPMATVGARATIFFVATVAGVAGSLIDSLLGATCQRTLYDRRMKKVVEVHGGSAVVLDGRHADAGAYLVLGYDLLDNNGVNLASAALTVLSTTATVAAMSYARSLLPF